MTDRSDSSAEPAGSLPPILQTERESAPTARRPWYVTIAPAYLGVFIWAPFFDSLWISDITRFGLVGLVGSAILGSLLCFGLFFCLPALWGFHSGQRLGIVAAPAFGTLGSEWITGIAVGVANIVWYAVAIDFAVDATLLGLRASGLLAADSLNAWDLGPIIVKSLVFLCTALFWIYITGMSGILRLSGVVAALMRIYTPIALLLLAATALCLLPLVGWYRVDDAARIAEEAGVPIRGRGQPSVIQLMTGFFALAGLAAVDWGATARRRTDVVMGGLIGIVLAASVAAAMSLLVVAGTVAQTQHGLGWFETTAPDPIPLSFQWGVFHGIGGVAGGAILILFGLAALAPACYSVGVYSQKLSCHWPQLRPAGWTWIGGVLAFLLSVTFCATRLNWIYGAMGDVFAPVIGAMAGEWLRQRGSRAGLNEAVNRTGLIAWGAGVGVAVALEIDRIRDPAASPWWQSTSISGFATAFMVYSLLASLVKKRTVTAL